MKRIYDRIWVLEKKIYRIEKLIWYVAGSLTIKFGSELVPMVSALW